MLPHLGVAQSQPQPTFTMFLIGDAGKTSILTSLYRDTLQYQLATIHTPKAVVYLGDNIYQNGMPPRNDKTRRDAEAILNLQIKLVRDGSNDCRIYFIPGNHDWKQGRKQGLKHILLQQQWFDSLNNPAIKMFPRNGCSGPIEIPLTESLTMILLDTQWPLHPFDKSKSKDGCSTNSTHDIITKVEEILQYNVGKRVIIAGHHPMLSYGNHGGVFSLKQHIFPFTDLHHALYIPLPMLGSTYPFYRKYIGDRQDIAHHNYKSFRCQLMEVMEKYPGTIYVSGHDHSLQYSFKDSVHYIVSGAGAETLKVKTKGFARFTESKNGFVRLTVYDNGKAEIIYFATLQNQKTEAVFTQKLDVINANYIRKDQALK